MLDADAGRLPQALASARMRQRTKPRDVEACKLLGLLLQRAGELDQAIHFLGEAARLDPGVAMHHHQLAVAQMQRGLGAQARASWSRAVELDPSIEDAWLGLCAAHLTLDDAAAAIEAARRGLALVPDWPALTGNLTNALCRLGRTDEAIEACERVLERSPDEHALRSNLLLMLSGSARDAEAVLAAHRAYGARFRAPRSVSVIAPAPDAPLRIGLLSSDLRSHSVGYFAAPIIEHAPPGTRFVAFVRDRAVGDPLADRLRPRIAAWHAVQSLDDGQLDALIRSERLDLLVELNGHTAGSRLPALAAQPAPRILSAIGYPDTTGLPAIGLRLVDSVTDPPGAERRCTERLLRLDPCFLCFTPPTEAPEPAMPAAEAPFTFGSFNNVTKIGAPCVDLWARALHAVPGSRMLLKFLGSADPSARAALLDRFAQHGIDEARVRFIDYTSSRRDHLACYHQVHVALDTTPYNGTTTTCEALWMGVPVVTTLGDRHVSRVSASLLRASGLGAWVAETPDAFVRIAASLAGDRAGLAERRMRQRTEIAATPAFDALAYARRFHAALRAVCEGA